ncbi:mechanosensitive ion channel family protein [Hymenobacter sp. BT186]|uniref:Mechanosensitive ion channel family protein n=1 Tax=Hymenobacter telluris TaxID=2816474 RepID=A0A939EU68_9BACT|nr:mechanosensitive ion channel family protein [Hymenobacter telluris]MBO0357051.1 mechanosensitive ion channel family protein [Hymenobacter telluris]MBW3373078.1 mechanosensitive ion channel family protein [Hymenobacter norwichensis]
MSQRLTALFTSLSYLGLLALWLLVSGFICPIQAAAQAPVGSDSARTQTLSTDTRTLRQLDSLRRQASARLSQVQQELLTLKNGPNRAQEQKLTQELTALRAADSLRRVQARRHIDSLRQHTRGYPVVLHNDTLFYVYTKLGPFSPRERAALIAEKVQRLEADVRYHPDSLRLYPSEQTIDLLYGELVVQSISDNDALWMNTPRDSLARQYRARIVQTVATYKQQHSFVNILKEIGLVLLVLVAFYFVVRFVNQFFRWLQLQLTRREDTWFRGVRLGTYDLFTPRRELETALLLLNVLRWVVIFLIIYLVLPLLFSIFPGTQDVADMLLGYVLTPLRRIGLSLWHYLPNLITIVVIVTVFRYLLRGLHFLKEEIRLGHLTLEGFYPDWANPTYQIVRVLVFAFLLVVIFPYLPGSESPIFKGVSVFLGFLFTFGSAGSLSNIVAGLVLTYMRAYKLGDRVKIGDVTGDIIEKNLLVTRIRTIKNEEITIPNSSIMSSYTTNFTSAAPTLGLVLHTTVTIGYDVPWPQVHELLVAAALGAEGVLPEPKPFVLQTSLDDYYASYQLNAYTREASKQALIYSRIHQNIQDEFNKAGIELMSPHYRAVRDGHHTTIPTDFLPKDYVAPKFRVEGNE